MGKKIRFGFPNIKQRESDISTSDSEATTVLPTQMQDLTVSAVGPMNSGSDVMIQPSGFITWRRKRRRSSSTRNMQRAKRQHNRESGVNKENLKGIMTTYYIVHKRSQIKYTL